MRTITIIIFFIKKCYIIRIINYILIYLLNIYFKRVGYNTFYYYATNSKIGQKILY